MADQQTSISSEAFTDMSPPTMSMLGVFVQPIVVHSYSETQFFPTSKEGQSVTAIDRSLSFLGRQVTIKGSSKGFLLCSFELEPPHINFVICNPLTREWRVLPRRPEKACCNTVVGFSCNLVQGTTTLDSVAFQVVLATARKKRDSTMRMEIVTFSSETGKWRRSTIKSDIITREVTGLRTNVVLIDKVIYWMRIEDLWAYDTTKHCLDRVESPVGNDGKFFGTWSHTFGESKGKLYFLRCNALMDLEIWVLNKKSTRGTSEWVLYGQWSLLTALKQENIRRRGLPRSPLEKAARLPPFGVECIHPRDSRRILIVWRNSLYWYNLFTDELELLVRNNEFGDCFAYERPATTVQTLATLFSRM